MIDYHIHLENGPLTLDWLSKFWEQAQKRGISEIAITEHCHKFEQFYPAFEYLAEGENGYDYMRDWLSSDFQASLDDYLELLELGKQKGIPVKKGIEVDYLEQSEEVLHNILDSYAFDYILGSVHVIDKWGFDYFPEAWEGKDVDEAYQKYYETMYKAANSGLFDVMAHLDVIKVFGHKPTTNMDSYIDKVLKAMAVNKLTLEVSTAGLRKPVGEMYPTKSILQRAAALQIPITIASDAHYPEDVGADWEKATMLARRCGYREYCVFMRRESYAEKIPK